MASDSMRLHILSDLHLEFGAWQPDRPETDVIILAGDIHLGREGRKWIRRWFPNRPVIYVLGNHEFYRHRLPELTRTLQRETNGSDIHLLENAAVELDGFTFLGCTLWSDFLLRGSPATAMAVANQTISDYSIIDFSTENRLLQPPDTARLHAESVAWLENELVKRDPAKTVVVTHHAPSARSIPPFHANSPLNPAFVSNLDNLVESSKVPLWIHGHTHYNVDYKIGGTRVLANQRGYPDEIVAGFNPGMVVEV